MRIDQVIIEPVLSEKTNLMREVGKYVFKVDKRANKFQVMQAVRVLFSVHPVSCNIMMVKGKPKRGRAGAGYTASWKKAIVTLQKGEKIGVFEGA
ncbi:MAG: 50S ribosomal protein L23 [Spirochaetales bacterium]